jgi:hypothetical protein
MREAQENQYISEVHSPWKIRADVETGRKIRLSLLIDSSEAIAASQ